MSEVKKTKVHLISGFLGTGKTTALKSLMAQKDPNENGSSLSTNLAKSALTAPS